MATPTPEDVSQTIDQLVQFILQYAVTLAAISALAMALIELIKALGSARDRFHKWRLLQWLGQTSPAGTEVGRVYESLIQLTTGDKPAQGSKAAMDAGIEARPWVISYGNALFALSLDKMMGQIQDAADTAMANPNLYPDLYAFLTCGARDEDVGDWRKWAQEVPIRSADKPEDAKRQAETYARIRQVIRRRLDAFQVTSAYQWETINQMASMILGGVILFGSLLYLTNGSKQRDVWVLLLASLIGGIMAPVAKDLVIALKKARSGV
jgi:hypothetical protein